MATKAPAPGVKKSEKIWMDGELVPWDGAVLPFLTHTFHYGLGVFEGIRCYRLADGRSAVFRLKEHIHRLCESAHICLMKLPFNAAELEEATIESFKANKLAEGYARPVAFIADGAMGLGAINPTRVGIAVWPWAAYLGEEGLKRGIRAKVSSLQRMSVRSSMVRGKITGQYVNSILAKREAQAGGYDEAILLDQNGLVAEGSGENIFIVRHDKLITPPLTSPILAGITRDTVLTFAQERGIPYEERAFTRDELYVADEAFLTGTAAEITPLREIDDRVVGTGKPGPLTRAFQDQYHKVSRAEIDEHRDWLTVVE